jgi:hypothetical protein
MTRARIPTIVIIVAGAGLLVAAAVEQPSRAMVLIAAVIVIAAATFTMRGDPPAAEPSEAPAPSSALRRPSKRNEIALVATVISPSSNERSLADLQRILAGIIVDERGKLVSSNGGPLVATFGNASAAVHAAQRMLSNVDALGRRLDRFIALSVGIDDSIDEATRLEQLTHQKRIAVLVSGAAATAAATALAPVEEGLYSFAPLQQRLPGF